MRRSSLGTLVIGSALALAGCSTSAATGPEATSASASPPTALPGDRLPLMSYPDTPTPAWTFSAQDAGVAGEELTLVDPTLISQSVEGWVPPAPIDAGDTLVMGVWPADGPPSLAGIDAASGAARWTFAPERGQLTGCAQDLLDSALVCSLTDSPNTAGVVLVDVATGQQVGQFDVPWVETTTLAVAGESIVSLTYPSPVVVTEDGSEPNDVYAHHAQGTELWSTRIVKQPNDFPRGPSSHLVAGPSLATVEIAGSVFVLATDDGEILLERDGHSWAWAPAAHGGLLYEDVSDAEPAVTVVAADGTEVVTLPGFTLLHAVLDDGGDPYLRDSDGEVVTVDMRTGATSRTGVTLPPSASPESGPGWPQVSELDGTILVFRDALSGYAPDDAERPVWEHQRAENGAFGALTDGSALYVHGLDTGAETPEGEIALAALDVADGSVRWTFTAPTEAVAFEPVTVARAGGRLVIVDRTTLTALEP